MPYTGQQFRKYSYYKNIEDADKEKQLKDALNEKKRMEISGSIVDATNPIRDENGFLLSFESPDKPGNSIEEDYQYVRLQVRQNSGTTDRVVKFFGNDIQFLEIFPREPEDDEPDVDIKALEKELNDGIDFKLGTFSKKISSGQKQRLALARCFYDDKSIIILDEATNALDVETEKEIFQNILKTKNDKTIIIVSHNINNIGICDKVYKIDSGKIVKKQ